MDVARANWISLTVIGVLVVALIVMVSLYASGFSRAPSNHQTGSTNPLWWYGGGDAGADREQPKRTPPAFEAFTPAMPRGKVSESQMLYEGMDGPSEVDISARGLAAIRASEQGHGPVMQ